MIVTQDQQVTTSEDRVLSHKTSEIHTTSSHTSVRESSLSASTVADLKTSSLTVPAPTNTISRTASVASTKDLYASTADLLVESTEYTSDGKCSNIPKKITNRRTVEMFWSRKS